MRLHTLAFDPPPAPSCIDSMFAATAAIEAKAADEAGQASLIDAFNVCEFAGLGPDGQPAALFQYALESLPQLDYPVAIGEFCCGHDSLRCTHRAPRTARRQPSPTIANYHSPLLPHPIRRPPRVAGERLVLYAGGRGNG